MIQTTVEECRTAYRAFRRIGEETRLPAKASWRVSRILGKLKSVVADFENVQKDLFLAAGGVIENNGVTLRSLERAEGEDDAVWNKRIMQHQAAIARLTAEMKALLDERVEISYDPIPLSCFGDGGDVKIAPCDFSDAGQFICEDSESKQG